MKKEGNKPHFRSQAKRAAYEWLDNKLKDAQRKLRDNKFKLLMLQREQAELKRDIAGLHQTLHEFRK